MKDIVLEAETRVFPDKFFEVGLAIADEDGEDLVGDGEDSALRFVGQAGIEDAALFRAGVVLLELRGALAVLKVIGEVVFGFDERDAGTALRAST